MASKLFVLAWLCLSLFWLSVTIGSVGAQFFTQHLGTAVDGNLSGFLADSQILCANYLNVVPGQCSPPSLLLAQSICAADPDCGGINCHSDDTVCTLRYEDVTPQRADSNYNYYEKSIHATFNGRTAADSTYDGQAAVPAGSSAALCAAFGSLAPGQCVLPLLRTADALCAMDDNCGGVNECAPTIENPASCGGVNGDPSKSLFALRYYPVHLPHWSPGNTAYTKELPACPPGTFGSGSQTGPSPLCSECPAGSHSSGFGNTACSQCPGGTFSRGTGNPVCSPCPPGWLSGPGMAACFPCAAGSFNTGYGNNFCTFCPDGTSTNSAEGSTACSPCSPGTYSNAHFGGDTSFCSPCPAGMYTSASRSTACSHCPAGTSNSPDHTACSPCPAGTYSDSGSAGCSPCPAGMYTSASGSTACSRCPAGTSDSSDHTACSPCPAGTYSDSDSAGCSPCLAGRYTSASGSTSCTTCPSGYFSNAGSIGCTACPSGTTHSSDHAQCVNCPQGTWSAWGRGDPYLTCLACSPGTYSSVSGTTACSACSSGTYAANYGSTTCTACPTGTYSYGSANICTTCSSFCPAGSFCNAESVCELCPVDYYQRVGGQLQCELCDNGIGPSGTNADGLGGTGCPIT